MDFLMTVQDKMSIDTDGNWTVKAETEETSAIKVLDQSPLVLHMIDRRVCIRVLSLAFICKAPFRCDIISQVCFNEITDDHKMFCQFDCSWCLTTAGISNPSP